jgi:taurine dioxygenase
MSERTDRNEATASEAARVMRVRPADAVLGAEVDGVDLRALGAETFAALHQAWLDYQVLLFRDQQLADEDLVSFSRRFGDLDEAPVQETGRRFVEGHPEIYVVSNVVQNGVAIGSLGSGEAVWHTDMSYNEVTPTGAVLYALEVTKTGGETGFISMYDAYDTLPADLKTAIEGKQIKHDASRNSAGELRKGYKEFTDPREAPGAVHSIVIRHPVTQRRALFLGRRPAGYVVGLPLEESEAVLDRLWAHATQQNAWFQKWNVGDLLMWDNRCVMHKRTAFDPNERRFMLRTQIKGARPVAA